MSIAAQELHLLWSSSCRMLFRARPVEFIMAARSDIVHDCLTCHPNEGPRSPPPWGSQLYAPMRWHVPCPWSEWQTESMAGPQEEKLHSWCAWWLQWPLLCSELEGLHTPRLGVWHPSVFVVSPSWFSFTAFSFARMCHCSMFFFEMGYTSLLFPQAASAHVLAGAWEWKFLSSVPVWAIFHGRGKLFRAKQMSSSVKMNWGRAHLLISKFSVNSNQSKHYS